MKKILVVTAAMVVGVSAFAQSGKYPEPQIKEEWNLVQMVHSCHNQDVYVYKDKLYNELFTRTLGWNGGDGVETTLLPGGHLFWSFNDSFYGIVNETNRARGNCNFPRNSIMVQKAGADGRPGEAPEDQVWLADWVQTTNPNADRYYQCRTHIRHPKGEKTPEQIERGDIDQQWLYWAGDGTVVDNTLQMIWSGVYNGTQNLMAARNKCLAIYSLEGQPGDANYMKLISTDHNFQNVEIDSYSYGQTLWEDEDGHTYLYGVDQSKENEGDLLGTARTLVARSATHDLRSEWEYYIKDESGNWAWQKEFPTPEQTKRSNIQNTSLTTPWIFKDGDYYYLVGQEFVFSKTMFILRGEHPWGPFTDRKQLFIVPNVLDKKGTRTYQNLYMPHLHQGLSREGELVFSTNTDCQNWNDNFNYTGSADFYRPFFYRIYNWKALFDPESEK